MTSRGFMRMPARLRAGPKPRPAGVFFDSPGMWLLMLLAVLAAVVSSLKCGVASTLIWVRRRGDFCCSCDAARPGARYRSGTR